MSMDFGNMFDELFDFNSDGKLDTEEEIMKMAYLQEYFDEDEDDEDEDKTR